MMTESKPEYEIEITLQQKTWDKVESIQFTLDEYTDHVGWVKINHLLTISPISDGAYRTYALIRGLAQQGDGVWWSLDKLAIFRGVSRVTLSRHLSELCECGLIERKRRVGTSSVTHFPALERIFPQITAQCAATALWGQVQPDDDLKELVESVAKAISPRRIKNDTTPVVSKMIRRRIKNDTTVVSNLIRKEEEIKKNNEEENIQARSEPDLCPICHKPKVTDGTNSTKDLCTCDQEAALAEVFGERPGGDNDGNVKGNLAVPVSAGGDHSPAAVIVDGMCRYNGLGQGIDALAEKDRKNWLRQVAEVCDRYGVDAEQARLAWQAYTVRNGYKAQVSPYYRSFDSEIGPLLAAARDGDITEKSLREEAEGAGGGNGGRPPPIPPSRRYKPPSEEQIESDKRLLAEHRKRRREANAHQ